MDDNNSRFDKTHGTLKPSSNLIVKTESQEDNGIVAKNTHNDYVSSDIALVHDYIYSNDNESHYDYDDFVANCGIEQPLPTQSNNVSSNIVTHEKAYADETLEKATYALSHINPNDLSRIERTQIATALKNEFGDSADSAYVHWVSQTSNYKKAEYKSVWKNAGKYKTTIKTLYYHARANGYKEEHQKPLSKAEYAKQQREIAKRNAERMARDAKQKAESAAEKQRAQTAIADVIPFLVPAINNETIYLKNKMSDGRGAYILSASDLHSTAKNTYPFNQINKKALVIPFQSHQGEYIGAQVIYSGKKRQVKGSTTKHAYAYLDVAPMPDTTGKIYIGEGYGTVNTAIQARVGSFGVMAIDSSNLPAVAELVRSRHPYAQITILCDNDKSGAGQKASELAAKACDGIVLMPEWIEGQKKSTDWNDYHRIHGLDVVRYLLCKNHANSISSEKDSFLEALVEENDGYKTVTINQKYLGDAISLAVQRLSCKVLLVRSGLGSGKSTAVKRFFAEIEKMISENRDSRIAYITPRIELNRAEAEKLRGYGFVFYQDAFNDEWLKERGLTRKEALKRVVITGNSVPRALSSGAKYDLVAIDESESVAQMLVSKATDNPYDVLAGLTELVNKSTKTLMLDAHLDVRTKALVYAVGQEKNTGILINKFKGWTDTKLNIIKSNAEKRRNEEKRKAIIAMIMKDLIEGKKVYLASSTKVFLKRVKDEVMNNREVQQSVKESIILIDSNNNSDEAKAIIRNPSLISDYSLFLASPTLSVGISFDDEYDGNLYADFTANNNDTGDSDDAIQALARLRNMINKLWTVALPEETQTAFNNPPETTEKMLKALESIRQKVIKRAKTPTPVLSELAHRLEHLYVTCQHFRYHNKNSYAQRFMERIENMGISVTETDASTIIAEIADKNGEIARAVAKRNARIARSAKLQTGVNLSNDMCERANYVFKQHENELDVVFFSEMMRIGAININDDDELIFTMFGDAFDYAYQESHAFAEQERKTEMVLLEEANVIEKDGKTFTTAEYEKLNYELRINPDDVNQADIDAMERYQAEKKLGLSFAESKNDYLSTQIILAMTKDGVPDKLKNREIAGSSAEFESLLNKGYLNGFGESQAFKVNSIDKKMHFSIKKKAYKYANEYLNKEFSHKSLKRSAFHQWLKRNYETIRDARIFPIAENWEKKLGIVMKYLVTSIGYKAEKVKGGWLVVEDDDIEFCNSVRKEKGMNWVLNTEYIISKYNGIVGYVLSKKDLTTYNIRNRDLLVISDLLANTDVKDHKKVIEKYKNDVKAKGNFNAIEQMKAENEAKYFESLNHETTNHKQEKIKSSMNQMYFSSDEMIDCKISGGDIKMLNTILVGLNYSERTTALKQYKAVIKLSGKTVANQAMIEEYSTYKKAA